MLVLLALALIAQTPHTATVFHRLAPSDTVLAWTHASSYAIALEFATLVFVVRKHSRLAWTFAIVSVLVNIAYYYSDALTIAMWMQIALVSLALPSCIAFYSHAMVEDAHAMIAINNDAILHTPALVQSSSAIEVVAPNAITGDAKSIYLKLRMQGHKHKELVQKLGINANTALAWWRRANKVQLQSGD